MIEYYCLLLYNVAHKFQCKLRELYQSPRRKLHNWETGLLRGAAI